VTTSAKPRAAIGAALVPLLALAIFINYVDRGNLATAAPLIKDELKLSSTQMGVLLSAFFWTYTPSQLLAGWLAERINAYRTLALGLAIWSIATATSGLASGFGLLIALRLLLGIGESAAFPCSSKVVTQHLPAHKLGAANGLIGVGLALGPAFGTFVGGLLMARTGWRAVFMFFGLASLLWLVPWWAATRHVSRRANATAIDDAPRFVDILRRREAWGASLGHFSSNYSFYFVITWLPLYLVTARGMSVQRMAGIGGMIYLVYAFSSALSGWVADRIIQAGWSATLVRKTLIVACHLMVAASMGASALGGATTSVAALFCAGVAFGIGTPSLYAIAQTLAGPRAAGKWMGVQNCIGNLAGILAPIVTGVVVDRTAEFFWAFMTAGAVALTGILGWALLIRRVEPLRWNTRSRRDLRRVVERA
jgi:MFS family permease